MTTLSTETASVVTVYLNSLRHLSPSPTAGELADLFERQELALRALANVGEHWAVMFVLGQIAGVSALKTREFDFARLADSDSESSRSGR